METVESRDQLGYLIYYYVLLLLITYRDGDGGGGFINYLNYKGVAEMRGMRGWWMLRLRLRLMRLRLRV